MKTNTLRLTVISFIAAFLVAGCGQKAQNSQEAIELSKAKGTVEEQAKFLVQQANQFINSKAFDEAVQTAQYVLSNLDTSSAEATSIIEKAQAELQKLAAQKIEDVKSKVGSLGQ